ncbi:MAG: nickel-responsive transcriptional regulator NikR [Bryobacterales bacterium]|nr:nickel-responsive transcriptional regulator NikR [Bryobacterales bacterium]
MAQDGKTPELERIGVAIDGDLLEKFDNLLDRRGYKNRSEAFRDLIRGELVSESARQPSTPVVGTAVTLLYDHHVRRLSEKLTALQHEFHHAILSTLHVHLDQHNCLEVIVVQGTSAEVQKLADLLIAAKGVKHGKLVLTATVDVL